MDAINSSQPQNHTLRNTVIGAGIGASVGAASNALDQKRIIKEPDKFIANSEKYLKSLENQDGSELKGIKKFVAKSLNKGIEFAQELVKSGQIDKKAVAKAGAIGAAVVGGATLAVNLIKSKKTK